MNTSSPNPYNSQFSIQYHTPAQLGYHNVGIPNILLSRVLCYPSVYEGCLTSAPSAAM